MKSITWQALDDALGAAVSSALREAALPALRVRTAEYAERGAEVEIYYYPKDAHAPRNELLTAAEALRAALGEGIDIGGVWLYPEDGIETDASDGVLAAMLRLEWIETAGEPEGEPMEELEYNNTGSE